MTKCPKIVVENKKECKFMILEVESIYRFNKYVKEQDINNSSNFHRKSVTKCPKILDENKKECKLIILQFETLNRNGEFLKEWDFSNSF